LCNHLISYVFHSFEEIINLFFLLHLQHYCLCKIWSFTFLVFSLHGQHFSRISQACFVNVALEILLKFASSTHCYKKNIALQSLFVLFVLQDKVSNLLLISQFPNLPNLTTLSLLLRNIWVVKFSTLKPSLSLLSNQNPLSP